MPQQTAAAFLRGVHRSDLIRSLTTYVKWSQLNGGSSDEHREIVRLNGKLRPRLGDLLAQPHRAALCERSKWVYCATDSNQARSSMRLGQVESRRRSGLRSFPVPRPEGSVCPGRVRPPDV